MTPPLPDNLLKSYGVVCACSMQDMASLDPASEMVESKEPLLAELRDLIPIPEKTTASCETLQYVQRLRLGHP